MAKSGYQYETSPRKLEPEYNPQRKKISKTKHTKAKKNAKSIQHERNKRIRQTLAVLAIFVVLVAISYRNSQINESFSKVQDLKSNLAAVQKENEQLEVNIENSLNLNNIEQAAKEKLGMQKLTNKQTVYIELPKKDYVKSANEEVIIEDDGNFISRIINKFFNK